jgi:hypothetical protein
MSSKYQKTFTTPDNFHQVLKDFTREVLRVQPPNIYEFGYKYFTDLAKAIENGSQVDETESNKRDTIESSDSNINAYRNNEISESEEAIGGNEIGQFDLPSEDEIGAAIRQELSNYADDQNSVFPYIARRVLIEVVPTLNEAQMYLTVAENEVNDAGKNDVDEFSARAAALVHQLIAGQHYADDVVVNDNDLVMDLTRSELEDEMRSVFQRADPERTGGIKFEEFVNVLSEADVSLNRRDITLILSEAPVFPNTQNVNYEAVVGKVHKLLFFAQMIEQEAE